MCYDTLEQQREIAYSVFWAWTSAKDEFQQGTLPVWDIQIEKLEENLLSKTVLWRSRILSYTIFYGTVTF